MSWFYHEIHKAIKRNSNYRKIILLSQIGMEVICVIVAFCLYQNLKAKNLDTFKYQFYLYLRARTDLEEGDNDRSYI